MCCVGGVARNLYASQKVTGSNPAGCRVNFFTLYVPFSPNFPVVGTKLFTLYAPFSPDFLVVGTRTKDSGL